MPKERKRSARPRHDASYKSFFGKRRTVIDSLSGVASDLSRRLDFSSLERLPASFVTEHLGQRHADMLWRIRTLNDRWLYLLVLLEFQSTIDGRMSLRMMDYTLRVLLGLDRDDLGPGGEYPCVLPVVVYNGEPGWSAAADILDLFGPVPDELLGYLPRHRYLLIDIQALDPSLLAPDNVLAMIARFEQARTPEDVEALVAPLADWLARAGEPELLEAFRVWITLVLGQRFGPAGRELEQRLTNEEEGRMTTLIERSRKWGEEFRREWTEKGMERGRLEGERELVCRLAARRFGAGAVEGLVPLLDRLSDPERIAAMADAVFECETAEEFHARARAV